jgi:hypothetical protein
LPRPCLQAQLPTPYVWLDLVCIPQLGHDPVRQAEGIAKQGAIFVNAMACIVWLNHVRSWERLLPAITWLGLSYLQFHSGLHSADVENYRQKLFTDADDGSDLFQKIFFPSHIPEKTQGQPQSANFNPTREKSMFHSKYCCSRLLTECLSGLRLCRMSLSTGGIYDFSTIFGFPD